MFTCSFTPGRSRVFSVLFSYSFFCAAPLASAAGIFVFPSASAGSFFGFVGSTPQPGSAQAYAPLSGTSKAPSVLLSQCLVRVLLSLYSGFVAQVATGAVAPVHEAFVPHLCLPPLTLVSAFFSIVLGSYPHAGCRFFAVSSSYLLFFVEFFLIPLLLFVMSFYLRLSVASPHLVATARGVYLFASDLPESSLCLLVCLRVLLGGVSLLAGSLESASPV